VSVFLSAEWFEEAGSALSGLRSGDNSSASVQYVVSGSPDGKVVFHLDLTAGEFGSFGQGKADDPDIILSCSYDTALSVVSGDQTPEVVFMTGALKVEGDHALWLLGLRPAREAALQVLAPITGP